MTVEEIIAAAQNGDKDAAIAIATYFEESDLEDKYDQALPWYEKAAISGSHAGLMKALIVRTANADFRKHIGEWDEMTKHIMSIASLCNKAFEAADEFDADELAMIGEKFRYACYLVALERYIHNDFKTAIHRLEGIEEAPTEMMTILKGCAVFDDALETNSLSVEVIQSVYTDLCPLEYKLEMLIDEDTDDTDEYLLASGIYYLSGIIRNAPFSNIQRAYDLLIKGVNCLSAGQGRQMLEDELRHYKQKVFGGLQYVK